MIILLSHESIILDKVVQAAIVMGIRIWRQTATALEVYSLLCLLLHLGMLRWSPIHVLTAVSFA